MFWFASECTCNVMSYNIRNKNRNVAFVNRHSLLNVATIDNVEEYHRRHIINALHAHAVANHLPHT